MAKQPPNEHGGFIKRQSEARRKVQRFRDKFPDNKVEGLLISSKLIQQLIHHKGCETLKFYYALDDDDELTLVLAPADRDGQRIGMVLSADGTLRHVEAGVKDAGEDHLLNQGTRIPPPEFDL